MPWDGVHVLVQRARAGDPAAWTDLHALVKEYLLGLAQKLLGPGWQHQSAHDLSQDVWVKFATNIGDFRGGCDDANTAAALRAWLGQTATNLAKNYARDNRTQERTAPPGTVRLSSNGAGDSADGAAVDPPADDPTPSHDERLRERRALIERALARLPEPTDRQMVDLHYFQDWPLRRVADELDLTYDQVRYRMDQIKLLLHDELRSRDADPTQP
jgi:RNA polymerase sigma factor (sigma-70 family)